MAQFISDLGFDFRNISLFGSTDLGYHELANNLNRSFSSADIPGVYGTYAFEDLAGWWSSPFGIDASDNIALVGGTGLTLSNGRLTNGYATGFMSVEAGFGMAFLGFRVLATQLQAAIDTVGQADDIAIFRAALSGADRITGSAQADFAYGWSGHDKLFGNGGNDSLSGNAGDDTIRGGTGNDLLSSGSGADVLFGDAGADRLNGDIGRDTLTGGAGADRFIFVEGQLDGARVTDFQNGLDTVILDAAGTSFTVSQALAAAVSISGGVRFDLGGGDILTVLGVTKAQLADDILIA